MKDLIGTLYVTIGIWLPVTFFSVLALVAHFK